MNRLNFNQLKNVKTPEGWIENALNIPNVRTGKNSEKRKGVVIPFGKVKYIATAASVVLCCALGVFLFSHFDKDGYVVPVASKEETNNQNTTAANSNDKNNMNTTTGNKEESKSPHLPDNTGFFNGGGFAGNGSSNGQNSGNSDKWANINLPGFAFKKPDSYDYSCTTATKESEAATNAYVTLSTCTAIYPTQSVAQSTQLSSVSHGAVTATQGQSTAPIVSASSVYYPTETQKNTMNNVTNSSTTRVLSTDDYLVDVLNFEGKIIFVPAQSSVFNIHGAINCHIVAMDGTPASEKFSPQEVCVNTTKYVFFAPAQNGIKLKKGQYYVTFYDNFGNEITRLCSITDDSSVYFYE